MRNLVVIFTLISTTSYAEYWGELKMNKALVERLNVGVSTQFKLNTELYEYRTEVGLAFQPINLIEVALYYKNKQYWTQGEWDATNVFSLRTTLRYGLGIVELVDVNRIDWEEFRAWEYRNSLEIKGVGHKIYEKTRHYGEPPIVWKIRPRLKEELFLDLKHFKITENRLLLGVGFEVERYLEVKLGFMVVSERGKHNKGVIMTTLELHFLELD